MTTTRSEISITPSSIIVIGDAKGRFDFIFDRITAVNARSGPLDLAFFVGDFFGENGHDSIQSYLKNEKTIPIKSYFIATDCNSDLLRPEGNQLCDNLYYLGKFGIQSINGLKLAYLSGIYDFDQFTSTSSNPSYYTMSDIKTGYQSHEFGAKDIDILLTSEWPSNCPLDGIHDKIQCQSPIVQRLLNKVQPQYHFCAMNNVHHQLPPFNYPDNTKSDYFYKSTHFVGLSNVPSPSFFESEEIKNPKLLEHRKYLYSLRMCPLSKLHPVSTNIWKEPNDQITVSYDDLCYFPFVKALGSNPFITTSSNPKKRKLNELNGTKSNDNYPDPKRGKFGVYQCRKCQILENEHESHLVLCQSPNCMLLLALNTGNEQIHRRFMHFELSPKVHIESMLSVGELDADSNIEGQIQKLTECVSDFFRPNLLFFYEICVGDTKGHCARNLVSIPCPKMKDRYKLKYILRDIHETENVEFELVDNDKIISSMVTQYGYVDLCIYFGHETPKEEKEEGKKVRPNMLRYIHNVSPAKRNEGAYYKGIVDRIVEQLMVGGKARDRTVPQAVFTIEQERQYARKIGSLFQKFNPF